MGAWYAFCISKGMARLLLLVLLLAFASLAEANVVISEVLADPPNGLAGDANGDSKRDTYEDEFIELYNTGSEAVDISGWRLGDSSALDTFFQFPADVVIAPGSFLVLFGGGTPTGFTGPVYTDDGKIGGNGLTNDGEDVHLIDTNNDTVAVISHTPWPGDQSPRPPSSRRRRPSPTRVRLDAQGPVFAWQQPHHPQTGLSPLHQRSARRPAR